MTTTINHPALRGRTDHRLAQRARRRLAVPGIPTGAFWFLVAIVAVLNMFGLIMVLSASSVASVREGGGALSMFQRQAMWTVAGSGVLFVALMVSIDVWRRHAKLLLGVSLVLLVAVLVPGVGTTANGATRWLGRAPFQFQPSELAKFGLLVFLADLLEKRSDRIRDYRWGLVPVVAYLGVVAALIMAQPNLGTTLIIGAMVLAMLFVAGVPLPGLGATAAVGLVAASAAVMLTPFRRTRFLRFLDPWADPTGSGLQNVQALVGTANGGWFGRGLGQSRAKWGFLPEAHNDFIYAIIAEETGMLGALTVVLLFLGLTAAGAWVAVRADDRFAALVATGVTVWLAVQAFMNVGAVLGLMPITGVPLPFISFGGSSLMINLAAVGLLLNVARHPRDDEPRAARPRRA